jgi:hypothetical protein
MADGPGSLLRNTAATLICLSGTGQIATLWLRELTGAALLDGFWGTVYLIVGIGLYGHSRFSLFLGTLIPTAASVWLFYTVPQPEQAYTLRIAVDMAIALLCATVLWETRHHPSV